MCQSLSFSWYHRRECKKSQKKKKTELKVKERFSNAVGRSDRDTWWVASRPLLRLTGLKNVCVCVCMKAGRMNEVPPRRSVGVFCFLSLFLPMSMRTIASGARSASVRSHAKMAASVRRRCRRRRRRGVDEIEKEVDARHFETRRKDSTRLLATLFVTAHRHTWKKKRHHLSAFRPIPRARFLVQCPTKEVCCETHRSAKAFLERSPQPATNARRRPTTRCLFTSRSAI